MTLFMSNSNDPVSSCIVSHFTILSLTLHSFIDFIPPKHPVAGHLESLFQKSPAFSLSDQTKPVLTLGYIRLERV